MNLFKLNAKIVDRTKSEIFNLVRYQHTQFVPKHDPVNPADIEKLQHFLEDKQNLLVVTGAGVSTESGILSTLWLINIC